MLEQENLAEITVLRNFLRKDIKALYSVFFETDWDKLAMHSDLMPPKDILTAPNEQSLSGYALSIESMIECTSNEALGGALLAHAESFGSGIVSAFGTLDWDGKCLRGTRTDNFTDFSALSAIDNQKKIIIDNTEQFIRGKRANNILLWGTQGTGKTSCINACINLFKESGLRIINVKASDIETLPNLICSLNNKILKYIIVIDKLDSVSAQSDNVFDISELQSGNVLFYACGDPNCKAARFFGIKLEFFPFTQEEYLKTVEKMLSVADVEMTNDIKHAAIEWGKGSNELSGRLAQQFVTNILSK